MASVRMLFVHFSHFFGGNALAITLGLLTFPILTRLLTQEQYGALTLINATVAMAVAFAKGGLSDGIIRFYREHVDDPARLRSFTSTILARGVITSTIIVVLYVLLVPHLTAFLGVNAVFNTPFLVMALYLFVRPLNISVLNYLRAAGKTLFFSGTNITVRACSVVLSLTLLIYLLRNLTGYFLGVAIAEVIGTTILFRWLLSNYSFALGSVSAPLASSLIKFGAPLLLTELAYLLLQYTDRYLIVGFYDEKMLGLYSVGYNIPSYINDLVMFPLSYAIIPLYTELYTKGNIDEMRAFLTRALHYYVAAIILLCAGYAAVAREAIVLFASDKYADAAAFSPIILVGLFFLGMNSILNAGLYLTKRTFHILAIMLAAVVINVSMNLWLLPRWGATGSAVANVAACVSSSILTCFLSFRYITVRINIHAVLYYLVLGGILYASLIPIHFGILWITLLVKLTVGFAIVLAGVLYSEQELRHEAIQVLARIRSG